MAIYRYPNLAGGTFPGTLSLNPESTSDAARSLVTAAWLDARGYLAAFLSRYPLAGELAGALHAALPNVDSARALPLLHELAGAGAWPTIQIVEQGALPGGLAGYDALGRTLLLSEGALRQESLEPGMLARLLVEEIGHHVDMLASALETPGDEGAAFAALVLNADPRQPTDADEGLGTALLGDAWQTVELASVSEYGGYEGSQQQVALEGTLDNEISFSFDFYGIPDRFIVRYEGSTVVDTGFVSYDRSDTVLIKRGTANYVDVIVATADEGTAWQYSLSTREAGLPDTAPLNVVAVDGKFEDTDQDGKFELSGGTVQVGRKDGVAVLLRIEGGTVTLDKETLTVSGASVYAAAGGANDLMFKGGFTMKYKTAEAADLNVSDIYRIGGLDTDLDGFVIKPGEVRFDTSFEMPYQVAGYAINGDPIRVDTLVLGTSGLRMGGPSGTLVLPIGGEYSLLELFKVETTNHFISYDSPQDLIKYQAKFSIEAPIRGVDTKVEVDLSGENHIQIKDGKADLKGSIKLETEVPLKIVTFKGFQLDIDTTADPDTIEGTASIEFPWRTTTKELDLTLGFALDPLYINSVGFKVENLNLMMGRPDVYLQQVNLKVENTAPKVEDPVTVTGGVGFTYGPQITIGDDGGDSIFDIGKVYIARVDLEAKINKESLAGEGTLALISDSIIKVTGGVTLNWKEGFLQGDGEIVYLEGLGGGIATGQGQVKIDSSFNFSSYGGANVRLPEIGLLGPLQGVSLGAGKAQVAFTNNSNYSDDFIAAWGILPEVLPLVGGSVVGLRVEFDGSIERIGMANLPPAPSKALMALSLDAPAQQLVAAATTPAERFEIAGQHPYFVMFLQWSGDPLLDPDLVVTRPDGSQVTEATFAASGMYVVPALSSEGSVAVAVGPVGGAPYVSEGSWGISAANAAALGIVSASALLPVISDDAVKVDGVNAVDNGIQIAYTASSDDDAARTMLFYDTDNSGFDGTPIVTDLAATIGAAYLWSADQVTPGNYYVYAAVMSSSGVPVFDYYETPVSVDRSIDVAVSTSLKDIRVNTADSYYYVSVTYDIAVENRGARAATGVVVDERFDLLGSTDDDVYSYYYINDGDYNYQSLYNETGFQLDFGDVAAGATETVSLTLDLSYWVTVPVGGLEVAHRTAVTSNGFDRDINNNFDDGMVTFFDAAIEPTQTQGSADLSVALLSSAGGKFVGDDASYTLRVTNNGPDRAPSVRLNEYLSGLTNYDITVNGDQQVWGGNSSQQSVDLGDLAVGASADVTISGRTYSAGQGFSSSEVVSAVVVDPDESNNTLTQSRDVRTVAVSDADISLTGQSSNTQPAVGETVSFELTLTNKGPNVATSIVVKLDHSAGITLQSGSGVQGSFDPITGFWTVGNLNPDISRTFTITAKVNSLQGLFAAAEVVAMSESDPYSTPDNGSTTEDDDVSLLSDFPFLLLAAPEDDSRGAPVDTNIVLTFSEGVQKGNGSITIKTDDGVTVSHYDVATSPFISLSGNTLTLNPSADLLYGTHYRVEIEAGSIRDLTGNAYAGTTSYDFTTSGVNSGLTGTAGDDRLQGTTGDDIFTPGLGNDSIEASGGADTVILPMFPNVFSLSENPAGHIFGTYGADTLYSLVLNNVEYAQFGRSPSPEDTERFQTTIALSELVSGAAQEQLGRLTDLYLAFFGRAPDVGGLEYWQERLLEEGRDFATISKDFAWSTEAQALFPLAASNREFVRTVYLNCFGRQPDAGGWDYWTGRLDGLGVTDLNDRGAFVGEVILGAYATTSGEEDRSLLTNRHEAAMYYVNRLSIMPAEGFDAAINTLLARVTGDAATEDKAEDVIDHTFANPVTLTGIMTDQALLDSIWGA